MVEERYYLTKQDRDFLNRLYKMFSHQTVPSVVPRGINEEIGASPDIYIALVPEDGIPAATNNAGDDVPEFAAGDKPGSAECDVYQIADGQLELIGLKQTIYNMGVSDINHGWTTVKREKFGNWIADVAGGIELSHGIIIASCDTACNTYRVQRIKRVLHGDCEEEPTP